MQDLQERLLRRTELVQVNVTWASEPARVTPIELGTEAIEAWTNTERIELLASLEDRTTTTGRVKPRDSVSLDSLQKQIAHLSMGDLQDLKRRQEAGEELTPEENAQVQAAREMMRRTMGPLLRGFVMSEDRSPELYRTQVEEYLDAGRQVAPMAGIRAAVRSSLAELKLAVANETDRNFPRVEIELHVPGPVLAFEEVPDGDDLPPRPRAYGTRRPSPLASSLFPTILAPRLGRVTTKLSTMTIDNSASAHITFSPTDLRPRRQEPLSTFHLLVPAGLAGHSILATWTATSTGADGMASGSLSIEVSRATMTIGDLLRTAAPAEGD